MKKNLAIFITILVCMFLICSCSKNDTEGTVSLKVTENAANTTASESETTHETDTQTGGESTISHSPDHVAEGTGTTAADRSADSEKKGSASDSTVERDMSSAEKESVNDTVAPEADTVAPEADTVAPEADTERSDDTVAPDEETLPNIHLDDYELPIRG